MAMDSSWNNGGQPPLKPGMPLWAKLLAGCGIVFVLVLATCVGGSMLLLKRGSQAMQSLTAAEWSDLRVAVDQMSTEEGAKAFYAAHPAMVNRFPSEEAFIAAWKVWSTELEPLPAEPPSITSGRYAPNYQYINGFKRVQIVYVTSGRHSIQGNWENGTLTDFAVR